MPDRPRVSVITMVLNCAKYLDECIQSVLNQSCPSLEHVLVDGASTDGTVDILRHYAALYPGRLRFISEPDRGAGDAWNKGLALSQGRILGWLGADDVFESTAVASIVEFFDSHPVAYFVYAGVKYIDAEGRLISVRRPEPFSREELINERCVVPTPASFYRREVIDRVEGFDIGGNDLDFLIRVSEFFEIHRLDEVTTRFRLHDSSASTGRNSQIRKRWLREDMLVSRRHGGRWLSGYAKRYYMYLLKEQIRTVAGPLLPLLKRLT